MLAIQSATGVESPVDDTAEYRGVPEEIVSSEVATESQVKRDAGSSVPPSSANDRDRILDLLNDVQPRTWVFTGDNLGFEVQQARRGWVEHFSDYIHERLKRKQDMILNSSFADSTINHLLKDVDGRILRFQPDVVLIMPSAAECAQRHHHPTHWRRLDRIPSGCHRGGHCQSAGRDGRSACEKSTGVGGVILALLKTQ